MFIQAIVSAEVGASLLPFPPLVFALIAAAVFVALGFVIWSFRDVANRHSHKTSGSAGHASEHGAASGDTHH